MTSAILEQPLYAELYQDMPMKLRIIFVVLAAFVIVPWSGCAPPVPPVELPEHSISYQGNYLKGNEGRFRILEIEVIDMAIYPHLKIKDGFILQRAICGRQGGDQQGYAVAIHQASNTGFGIEHIDGAQGGFLFGPIESVDQAREYAEFMVHETAMSIYDREHQSIYTQADFENALSQLDRARIKTIKTPPTNITRVRDIGEGYYLVELVYACELYVRRVEYLGCVVCRDGFIDLQENYVFIEGGPGSML